MLFLLVAIECDTLSVTNSNLTSMTGVYYTEAVHGECNGGYEWATGGSSLRLFYCDIDGEWPTAVCDRK